MSQPKIKRHVEQRDPATAVPKCPHCGEQPCILVVKLVKFSAGAMAAQFLCAACECIVSVSALPDMRITEEPKKSLIV